MKDIQRTDLITCPHCGREYLPCEIYLPDYFLGKYTDIVRDSFGRVIYADGIKADMEEQFICDACHNKFKVYAKITFKSDAESKSTNSNVYKSKLYTKLDLFKD